VPLFSRPQLSQTSATDATLQVKTEHDILAQLAQQTLSFQVPTAVPTLQTKEPFVVLSSGAAACIFEIIPGKVPQGDAGQPHK
jgi:hypothetical protein